LTRSPNIFDARSRAHRAQLAKANAAHAAAQAELIVLQKQLRAAQLKAHSGDADHQISALKVSVRKQRMMLRKLSTTCDDVRRRYAAAKKQARSARAAAAHAPAQAKLTRAALKAEREAAEQSFSAALAESAASQRKLRRQLSARDEQLSNAQARCDRLLETQETLTAMGRTANLLVEELDDVGAEKYRNELSASLVSCLLYTVTFYANLAHS
jgi:hypothetical protein